MKGQQPASNYSFTSPAYGSHTKSVRVRDMDQLVGVASRVVCHHNPSKKVRLHRSPPNRTTFPHALSQPQELFSEHGGP